MRCRRYLATNRGTIEFTYPSITDCNSNGVDDDAVTIIANGTSNDDNGNGSSRRMRIH